ncbi:MAG: hypothetical protein O2960_06760 [Verrucomicrobia bacterium]|nr:hypothetical protein [Verrucomicrobiota bacterium]
MKSKLRTLIATTAFAGLLLSLSIQPILAKSATDAERPLVQIALLLDTRAPQSVAPPPIVHGFKA